MSWWTIFRQAKTHIFSPQLNYRSDKERMDADFGALLVIAIICVPIIITIGALIVLT